MAAVVHHSDDRMRILALRVLQNLRDDPRLTRPVALYDSHTFPDLETFFDNMCPCFDIKWFGLLCLKSNEAILYECNEAFAVFELTLGDLDAVADLDLQLRVVSYGLVQGFVVEKVPLVLIVVLVFVEVGLRGWVYLEHFHFLKTWTNIFRDELICFELLVQKSISEHHFSPDIEVFLKWSIEFTLAFIFDPQWVEQELRYSNKWRLMIVRSQ